MIRETLAEIAAQPATEWRRLLARRFPDNPLLVAQSLLWLHAAELKGPRELRPSLGVAGDERYELTIKLVNGATAAVWQAFDRKLGRNVAIKLFHSATTSAGLAQLIREARSACDVISDHVVRILDVHDAEPYPYIVMELVGEHDPERGELVLGTAASSCRPRNIAEAARWVMQVARGVHDAHTRNVFHRDLKPDNVLITPISRTARIADFGLAVSATTEHVDASTSSLVTSRATGPVCVSGTPEYMAPEQARGLPVQLDPRTAEDRAVLVGVDVWGLGALAYELVCGHPPWTPTTIDLEPWELAASGAEATPHDRTPWGERIPGRLRRIIRKAMALDPRARYETAARVANELEAFLARRPTSFDRGRPVRVALWGRRNPQLALAGLVAVVLVALTLVTRSTVQRLRAERDALTHEVGVQRDELGTLTKNVAQTREELDRTTTRLERGASDLVKLEHSIEQERTTYEALLEKKEAALREATTATRQLVDQLDLSRAQAEQQRADYERDLAAAVKDRDKARADRDKARADRDALKQQRDALAAERDDSRRALANLQQELARLAGEHAPADGTRGAHQ